IYRTNTPLGGTSGDTKVVAYDFNGDKKDDIAVVDPVDQRVNVYFSQGTDIFGSEQTISVPSPIGVVVGDFNADGIADLAALSSNGSVYIALNDGTGGFAVATPYNTGIEAPTSIAPAGLVSNESPGAQGATLSASRDLVVAGTNGSTGVVTPLISHSDGTFTVGSQVALSIHPRAVASGLFEKDVNDDVAVLSADGSLQLLSCPGDGTLGAPQTIFSNSLGSNVNDAVSAQFTNGEGIAFVTSAHSFGVTIASTLLIPAQNIASELTGTLPASVIGGAKFSANDKLVITARNSAVNGTASAELFLSPDASPADSIVTLASTNIKLALKPGKSKTVSLKLPKSLPASAASGQYHLILQVTDTTGITTTIDSGKTLNVAAPVVDLAGSFVKTPSSVKAGKKFSLIFEVTNLSSANVAAAGLLPIQFATSADGQLDDTAVPLLTETKRINIKPGKSIRFTLQTSLSSPAYLFCDLDPRNSVFPDDAAPSNNLFRTTSLLETT
ncbi:MAG TPA: VCBS repeat-containing protein, partial [Tepidisphaeraceae bacterium]|nr:VCBS repeat-containing protein [Tepidisphaeraceae bacterium]